MKSATSPTSVCINHLSGVHDMLKNDEETRHQNQTLSSTSTLPTLQNFVDSYLVHLIRNDIFQLSVLVGKLSALFLENVPLDSTSDAGVSEEARRSIAECSQLSVLTSQLLTGLEETAARLELDLSTCIYKKMELNRKKYPAELCTGKAGKYTEYSKETGITKDEGQSTLHVTLNALPKHASLGDALPELTAAIRRFATERSWSKYHLPRSLLLALLGELGELAELFQWSKDEAQPLSPELVDKAGQEIADVTIYLIRLADVCGIDMNATKSCK
ncbi:dCTP pyrophosphatase 1-like [Mayamaea pseudoterrestris]|nr:dCTP pyrophosphatase 1-like [Mayamaea pseudoterrestris]